MKKEKTLLSCFLICLLLVTGCASDQAPESTSAGTSPDAAAVAETSAAADSGEQASPDAGATEDGQTAPEIESEELTGFSLSFGDPEQTAPASGSDENTKALNSASFTFVLKTEDERDVSSKVTCSISAKPYDEPEETPAQHVSLSAGYDDLQALQKLVAERGLVERYCNYDDETEANREWQFAKLTLLYASGENAYHYNNTQCDIDAEDRAAVLAFFYDLLDKNGASFYHHTKTFNDDESFIEAFLGQAAWDALPVTTKDGETVSLLLTSDPTGRVFRLEAGEDVYAGNYKLKKKEDDGRWRIDFTLTMWPAAYTPMTKGGSVLLDTAVSAPDAKGTGTETLVIAKYPNTASLFDPFYGDSSALTFTRKRTEYFDEKPFATEAADEGASE